jgi:hypothetical protein
MRRILLSIVIAVAALAAAGSAAASPYVQYGVQDDAWLRYGPGTVDQRAAMLQRLGTDVVRYTFDWRELEPRRGVYDWSSADAVLRALHSHGIGPVVTLWGSPAWANGGRPQNWAPRSKWSFVAFAKAAARRYPYVQKWLIWNEPNKAPFLRPTSARTYVQQLLNPAYAAIHSVNRHALVGGGVTGPIAGIGGVSPITFIKQMHAYHARLDAYAHNPYAAHPRTETPNSGGCARCSTITMATLSKLTYWVGREWGAKRIWLTEYGYQTSPPDRLLGVSTAKQVAYMGEAALKAERTPRVDMLIHYLLRDDRQLAGWQSGLFTDTGTAKPAYRAFMLPLAQESRRGLRTIVWGQVRPRSGVQLYRLQQFRNHRWYWVGGTHRTTRRSFFATAVRADHGSKLRLWSPRDRTYSPILVVR